LASLLLIAQAGRAEVKTEERTKVEFAGPLGGFMRVFGGKSVKEGIVNKVAVKGDRKMTTNEETAELVDLSEEKVYQIDLKKKTYSVVTFAQMRQQMEDALARAKQQAAAQPEAPKQDPKEPPPQATEYVIDFKLQDSGQKKMINGFNCHEVVATITVRQKDKPAQDGAMVLTSSMWMSTPKIAAMKEVEDFDRRYAQKLALQFDKEMVEQMRPAIATYPGLGIAMGKLEIEKVKMDGTAVLTVMGFDAVVPPDQTAGGKPSTPAATQPPPQQKSTVPTSIGGLIGGLGKKAVPKEEPSSSSKPGSIMTTNHELLSVSTSVLESDISIPAGFKEKK
jgi:hypothetical protein